MLLLRAAVVLAMLVAASLPPATAANILPQVSLGPLLPVTPIVRFIDSKKPETILLNDISVGADGSVWAVSDRGVLRKQGMVWEHVPSISRFVRLDLSEGQVESMFAKARRIDIGLAGDPWVIDDENILHHRVNDSYWLRQATGVVDVAAGPSIWIIPRADSAFVTRNGGRPLVINLSRNLFLPWNPAFGEALAIDVGSDDTPYVVTSTGKLVRYLVHSWGEVVGDCIGVAGSKNEDCDDSRRYDDVSVSGDTVWITGASKRSGDFTYYHSASMFSGLARMTKMAPGMKRVAAGPRGGLYAVDTKGRASFGELLFDYRNWGPLLLPAMEGGTGLLSATSLQRFDGAKKAVAVPLGGPDDRLAAALNFQGELTLAFNAVRAANAPTSGQPLCLFAFQTGYMEVWSLCLDASGSNLVLSMAETSQTFPVDLASAKSFTYDVAGTFILQVRNGHATLSRRRLILSKDMRSTTKDDAVIADFDLPVSPYGVARDGNFLYVGGRDAARDGFLGALGTVRIWDKYIETDAVRVNPQFARRSDMTLIARENLLLEALVAKDANSSALEGFFRPDPTIDLTGLWWPAVNGTLPAIDTSKTLQPFGVISVPKVTMVRIVAPKKSEPIALGRLIVLTDSEQGVFTTSFEAAAERTYNGWQDPLTGRNSTTPYVLDVLDNDNIVITHPDNARRIQLRRLTNDAASTQIFNVGPLASFGVSAALFSGHDVRELASGPNRIPGAPKGMIFDPGADFANGKMPSGKLPPGVDYVDIDEGGHEDTKRILETTRELQKDRSRTYGANIGIPEIFSLSAETTFEKSVKTMEKEKTAAEVGETWWANFALRQGIGRLPLVKSFRKDVEFARQEQSGKRKGLLLNDLISTYGTHYAHGALYGARARNEKLISEREIERFIKDKTDASLEATFGGDKSKVKGGLKASLSNGIEKKDGEGRTDETNTSTVSGGSIAADAEEQTTGDDRSRSNLIAMDLRPLSELLSPVYFDDPGIYVDLRHALEEEIGRTVLASTLPDGLSDESLLPSLFALKIHKINGTLISGGKMNGTVTVERLLADGKRADSIDQPALAVSGEAVEDSKNVTFTPANKDGVFVFAAHPDKAGLGKLSVNVSLKLPGSAESSIQTVETIDLNSVRSDLTLSGRFTVVGKNCQCMTACPEGYADVEGVCRINCPDGLVTTNDLCVGSKATELFALWDKDECEAKYPSRGCEIVVAYVVAPQYTPKCDPNYMRVSDSEYCGVICSDVGLKSGLGVLRTIENGDCARTQAPRSKSGISAASRCPAAMVPGNDCTRIEVEYSVQKMPP